MDRVSSDLQRALPSAAVSDRPPVVASIGPGPHSLAVVHVEICQKPMRSVSDLGTYSDTEHMDME